MGARSGAALGVVVLLAALNCLPLTRDGWTLALVPLFQGFGTGCTDVAANNQAVVVERAMDGRSWPPSMPISLSVVALARDSPPFSRAST